MSYGLNDEIEGLREEIGRLKAENTKLKADLEEAERWSIFKFSAGTKVLINNLPNFLTKKKKKKKKYVHRTRL